MAAIRGREYVKGIFFPSTPMVGLPLFSCLLHKLNDSGALPLYYSVETRGYRAVPECPSWQAAKVISAHPSPRSYNINTESGSQLRCNRRHLIKTCEDPPVCDCERRIDDDEVPSAPPPLSLSRPCTTQNLALRHAP